MTNDPAKIAAFLRMLIVYAACAVLAIIVGNLMTNPWTFTSLGFVGLVLTFLSLPLLLRWHHPLMILCWNVPIQVFFIKGDPKLCLVIITMSLALSIVERALGQRRSISMPSITIPLICLIGIALVTAKLTGGIGLKAFGSDVYGGKKYVFLIVAILGYFALTAHPIPREKARLYVTLYFAGGLLGFICDYYQYAPGFLRGIYLLIPPSGYYDPNGVMTRFAGTGWSATILVTILMVRYGLRGIFFSGRLWRPALFFIAIGLVFLGGFRSALILTAATIVLQFFLEGLHRTKLMPVFVIMVPVCFASAVLLASKLPFTFQRSLAFLPPEWVHLSPDARLDAEQSTQWRLDMWKAVLPEVPKHLLLGKGYAITMDDYEMMGQTDFRAVDPSQQGLALSDDFHNGPLSVILPFGIWGGLAFFSFMVAGIRVTYCNFRYCDPSLKILNSVLFNTFLVASLDFIFLGGSLADGMAGFVGVLGMSICINHGICRAPARLAAGRASVNIPFSRSGVRPRPVFQHRIAPPLQ